MNYQKLLERTREKRLKRAVEKRGGILKKFTGSITGDPDRLALLPCAWSCFIELKRDGEEPTKLQLARLRKYARMGFNTKVINSENTYLEFINEMDLIG